MTMNNSYTYDRTIEDIQRATGHSISSIRKYARDNPHIAHRVGRRYWFDLDATLTVITPKGNQLTIPVHHPKPVIDWSLL